MRAVAWLAVVAGGAGLWLAAPRRALAPAERTAPARAAQAASYPARSDAEGFAERLARVRREQGAVPSTRRNPFRFAESRKPTVPAGRADGSLGTPIASAPASPRLPALALAGIAGDETAEGITRTAILSYNARVLLVTAGDVLPTGQHVVRIDAAAIVLADEAGQETVLRLK